MATQAVRISQMLVMVAPASFFAMSFVFAMSA